MILIEPRRMKCRMILLVVLAGLILWDRGAAAAEDGVREYANDPTVGVDEKLGNMVPLDLRFKDEDGRTVALSDLIERPTALMLVYFRCRSICIPVMDEMMRNRKFSLDGTRWEEGFITTAAVMTKIWIDVFIGLWAFLLAMVWVYKIDRVPGEKVLASEIWHRFPKFVLGYFLTWFVYLGLVLALPELKDAAKIGAVPVEKGMRKLFFMLTFVSIGVTTNFKTLTESRFGRMIGVYAVALFVFIIPVALIVAWIFHHGMAVPVLTD